MNVVDSSGWLEYFAGSQNAGFFAPAIEDAVNLLVPVICLYEVYKLIAQQRGFSVAQTHIGDMLNGQIVEITDSIALSAAQISINMKLPMADSFILAVTRANQAVLWTQNEHFLDLPEVKYIQKKS